MAKIVKFTPKDLVDKNNSRIFEPDIDDDPVGVLAYTDFTKPTPILEGEDAERFIQMMEENERKAAERAKIPPTLEELKQRYMYEKMLYEFDKEQLLKREEELNALNNKIRELEQNLDGETED